MISLWLLPAVAGCRCRCRCCSSLLRWLSLLRPPKMKQNQIPPTRGIFCLREPSVFAYVFMAESQGQPAARARQPAGQRASSQKTRKQYEKQNSIFKPEVLLQKVLLCAYVFLIEPLCF